MSSNNPSSSSSSSGPEAASLRRYSPVSFFIANCRLLDLDKRSDWPSININTFSTNDAEQSLQNRIRCAEWVLFRLVEILDPRQAREVRSRFRSVEKLLTIFSIENGALFPAPIPTSIQESSDGAVSGHHLSEGNWRIFQKHYSPEDDARRVQRREV